MLRSAACLPNGILVVLNWLPAGDPLALKPLSSNPPIQRTPPGRMGHRRRQACPRGGLVDRSRLGWRLGLSLTHTRDASAGCGTWCKGGALMGPSRPPAGFCQGLLASFRPGAPWRLCLCHYVGFSSSRYVNPASRIDFTSTHPVSSLVQDLDGLLAPPAIIQKIQKDPYDSKGYTHTHRIFSAHT